MRIYGLDKMKLLPRLTDWTPAPLQTVVEPKSLREKLIGCIDSDGFLCKLALRATFSLRILSCSSPLRPGCSRRLLNFETFRHSLRFVFVPGTEQRKATIYGHFASVDQISSTRSERKVPVNVF